MFVMSGFGSGQETGGSGLWFEVWEGDVTVHGVRDLPKVKTQGSNLNYYFRCHFHFVLLFSGNSLA